MLKLDEDTLRDFEPRLPAAEECSVVVQLARRAVEAPDAPCVIFEDEAWSNGATYARVRDMVSHLLALGLRKGDTVVNWLPNGQDHLTVMLASFYLGVVEVPLNTAYRGGVLEHALLSSGARVMFAHPVLVERLRDIATGPITTVVVLGGEPVSFQGVSGYSRDNLPRSDEIPEPVLNQPWETAAVIFSSGTTGPSKGVLTTFAQQWTVGQCLYSFLRADDRMLVHQPLFHIGGLGAMFAALTRGGTIAVCEPVSPRRFWSVLAQTDCTAISGLPTGMVDILLKEPERPSDRHNKLRVLGLSIVDATARAFARRFDTSLIARYSMSETSCIMSTPLNPSKDGVVGRPRKGIEVRLVDDHDCSVPYGEVGEFIVRSSVPWVLTPGYHGDAEATAQAWRNGWFHTGDLGRQDADGDYVFVDRKKDAIRRRAENISAWEVENEIRRFPAVDNVAVIAAKFDGDEEVLAVIEPVAGATIDPAELINYLTGRMPHFMIPRFVRFMERLPRTQTNKVQKASLREEGLTPGCWDRVAAGIKIGRTELGPTKPPEPPKSDAAVP